MSEQRFPLMWPTGWKRTPYGQRQRADFSKTKNEVRRDASGQAVNVKRTGRIEAGDAAVKLEDQLDRLGAERAVLSTNVEMRMDGRPKSGRLEPGDPGAACYFTFNGKRTVLACDKWDRTADNIAAIANHIDALRRIDRYGVGTMEQAFAGYVALPHVAGIDWWLELGVGPDATPDQIDAAYKAKARTLHPDAGGSADAMTKLNVARDAARKVHS
jgi:hypothetical protein